MRLKEVSFIHAVRLPNGDVTDRVQAAYLTLDSNEHFVGVAKGGEWRVCVPMTNVRCIVVEPEPFVPFEKETLTKAAEALEKEMGRVEVTAVKAREAGQAVKPTEEFFSRKLIERARWTEFIWELVHAWKRAARPVDRGYLGSNGTRKLRKKHGRNMGRKKP